jgi:hypothetical protein
MRTYFGERQELKRGWLKHSQSFREKFFKKTTLPLMERGGSEHVERVELAGDTAAIITNEIPYEGFASKRFRYHLERAAESWRITSTEWECFVCKGAGLTQSSPCTNCGGAGWKDYGEKSS